jgi:hypothetical protein
VRALLLDFPFEFFDVGRGDEMSLSGHPWLRGGLRLLRYGVRPVPGRRKKALLVSVLTDLHGAPDYFLHAAGTYILKKWAPVSRKSEALRRAMPDKEAVVLSKAAREFIAEGKKEGRKEGRDEAALGIARGFLQLLGQKFGPLPYGTEERVLSATIGELERWLGRVIPARSIEEVFS